MKTFSGPILVLLAAISVQGAPVQQSVHAPVAAPTPAKAGKSLEGEWNGTLDTGGQKLRVVIKFKKEADGKLSGTLYSLDQSPNGIPVSQIDQTGDTIKLELSSIGGSYEGKMNAAGSEITGQWKQGGGTLPLVLRRAGSK